MSTRRTVFTLTACIAVIGSNSLVLSPIAPDVAADLASTVRAVLVAAAAYGLGTACGAAFLARYIDRFGTPRMLRWALTLFTVSLLISATAPALGLLVIAQTLAGLSAGIALPAIYTYAAQVAPVGRESETIGIVLTGWTLSLVAGVSLSAVIADWLHWRVAYGLLAGLAALALLLLYNERDVSQKQPDDTVAPSPWRALVLPGVARLLIICAAYMIAFYGVYAYVGAHLQQTLVLSTSAVGLITLAYGIGFGLAVFLDGVIDRIGAVVAMPFAYGSLVLVYLALALASHNYLLLVALSLVWGLCNHFGLNLLVMRLTAVDPNQRGTIMGLNSAVTYLCVFTGTLGFGPLYAAGGFSWLGFTAAGLCSLAVLLALADLRRFGRDRIAGRPAPEAR